MDSRKIYWRCAGISLCTIVLSSCGQSWGKFWQVVNSEALQPIDNTGTAVWARVPSVAPNTSNYKGVAVDLGGNVSTAGLQNGNAAYTYGGQSISSAASVVNNAMIVKHQPGGTALSARTQTGAGAVSEFRAVATDSAGNVIACGVQDGTGTFTYSGASASGANGTFNAVIVKFDSNGNGLWARAPNPAPNISACNAVATDTAGNVYLVGQLNFNGTYSFAGLNINGAATSNGNAMLIKFDSNGAPLWARSTNTALNNSEFFAVATDSSGNVYAAGCQSQSGMYTYSGQNASGSYASGCNAVIIKYDTAGNALWARTTSTGSSDSQFQALSTDVSGNIYAVGYQTGNGTYTYSGAAVSGPFAAGANPVIVKFDTNGNGLWAFSTSATTNGGHFYGVTTDTFGNVYAAGKVDTAISFTFGSQTITGTAGGFNPVAVKYNTSGVALWARTISMGSASAVFNGIQSGSDGYLYAAGYLDNAVTYSFGASVTATGTYASGNNALVVKYK